jgi:uncharacterized membrane protein YqaE (UPF0057 family)
MFLDPLFKPMINIGLGFIKLIELIKEVILFLVEILPILPKIFNPINLINDIITGIVMGVKLILNSVIGSVSPSNLFGSNKRKQYKRSEDTGSGIFGMRGNYDRKTNKLSNKNKNKVCIRPTLLRMILMVLCPPLALLQHLGLRGWFNVVICGILTIYGYYFPGLMYSMMHILC